MTASPAFDIERLFRARLGHVSTLGVAYDTHGPDWLQLRLPYDPRLIGDEDNGVLASGPILAMMDTALGMSVWLKLGRFRPNATLDLRVDYLRPAMPGRAVTGRGECYRTTRAISFARGIAHDGDSADPIAQVAGTFMFTDAEA